MENSEKERLAEEIDALGLWSKKVSGMVDALCGMLNRFFLEVLLKPGDLFAVRTAQEFSLVKNFLAECELLPLPLQNNASILLERGKLLFVVGEFAKAAETFATAAKNAKADRKKGAACFNRFLCQIQIGQMEEALRSYLDAVKCASEICELFDSQRYKAERILEVGVWGVGILCAGEGERLCVVKCVLDKKDIDVEKAFRDLRTLSDTGSPYILKMTEIGAVAKNQNRFAVTEYVEGPTLREYVEKQGCIPEEKCVPLLKKIAAGLEKAHSQGILHGDVRPGNILVLERGGELAPVIANFGFSAERERLKQYQISLSRQEFPGSSAVGKQTAESVEFLAPEQRNEPIEGKTFNVDKYSDVYAFGKTASYLLFQTTRTYAQHWQKLGGQELQDVLEKCLIENPRNRYQNFETVLSHLSTYKLGYERYLAGKYQEAIPLFEKAAAEENHPLAHFALYLVYRDGEGTDVREGEAERHKSSVFSRDDLESTARAAAEGGDSIAATLLGYMRRHGLKVAKDPREAMEWFKKGADGCSAAQCHLGHMHREGLGVVRDPEAAVKWYQKAAQAKNASAQHALGCMYSKGSGVVQNFEQAVAWYQRAAENGCSAAQTNLGHIYRQGPGMARDCVEADNWFSSGIAQDYQKAAYWYRKAADKGHPVAQANLACMYLWGMGVPPNARQAIDYLFRSARKGYPPAQYILGYLFRAGIGIAQNYRDAMRWFKKANERADEATKRNFQEMLRQM